MISGFLELGVLFLSVLLGPCKMPFGYNLHMLNRRCMHFTALIMNGPAGPLRMLVHAHTGNQHRDALVLKRSPNWHFFSNFTSLPIEIWLLLIHAAIYFVMAFVNFG